MQQLKYLILIIVLISEPAFAWNSMGHRIIGEIAYEHLTPQAKTQTIQLIEYLSDAYPYNSTFQTANSWADNLKQDDVEIFNNWHYAPHLLWALNQSLTVLKSSKSNQFEKAFFIRFLLHLVGDAHQPLHCVNNQDQGGNLVLLQNNKYNNLHSYWDSGLGLFDQRCGLSLSKSRTAQCFANKFQQDYPESYLGDKAKDLNPEDWITESYNLAETSAYQLPITDNYIQKNQQIIEQQIALAGYRLAEILNNLYK